MTSFILCGDFNPEVGGGTSDHLLSKLACSNDLVQHVRVQQEVAICLIGFLLLRTPPLSIGLLLLTLEFLITGWCCVTFDYVVRNAQSLQDIAESGSLWI